MDLEDWELLLPPDACDLPPPDSMAISTIPRLDLDLLINMNYFVPPSPFDPYLSQPEDRFQISDAPEGLSAGVAPEMASCRRSPPEKIFFEKKREAEFVDMKVESPVAAVAATSEFRRAIPHLDLLAFTFQEKKEEEEEKEEVELKEKKGKKAWRWGMETLFSIGVAATAMYVLVVIGKSSIHGKKQKELEPLQNHKVRFQMYADEEHHQVCLRLYV